MMTRHCVGCGQDKTIRGVWYLTTGQESASFYCESCYGASRGGFRGPAPVPESSPVGRFEPSLRL